MAGQQGFVAELLGVEDVVNELRRSRSGGGEWVKKTLGSKLTQAVCLGFVIFSGCVDVPRERGENRYGGDIHFFAWASHLEPPVTPSAVSWRRASFLFPNRATCRAAYTFSYS